MNVINHYVSLIYMYREKYSKLMSNVTHNLIVNRSAEFKIKCLFFCFFKNRC